MISKMHHQTVPSSQQQLAAPNHNNNHDKFNCFGDIQNMPIDFQPAINGHHLNNNNGNQLDCEYMTNTAKESMLFNVQPNSGDQATYIVLQNVNTYRTVDPSASMRIGQDLLILNAKDGRPIENHHHVNENSAADIFVNSPEDLKSHDDSSRSLTGSDVAPPGDMPNGPDEKAPDHHERRPMNAFLIFCKRHRGIVREKYPNLENRSITKILGDWWANLDKEDKVCYTSLAQEYKQAFFTAHPNFKWYKLPAPPLRAAVVPQRTISSSSDHDQDHMVFDRPMNGSSHADNVAAVVKQEVDVDALPNFQKKQTSNVGIFRFADETQMGGLNSLMKTSSAEAVAIKNEKNANESLNGAKKDILSQQKLHKVLGETRLFLNRTISGSSDSDSYINGSSSIKFIEAKSGGTPSSPDKAFEFDFEDDVKKSSRACKGKRYQEFMSARKVIPAPKKQKVRTTSSSSSTSLPSAANAHSFANNHKAIHTVNGRGDCETFDHLYTNHMPHRTNEVGHHQNGTAPSASVPNDAKKFNANDFELEEKIKALPARNLDRYLSRKRETKNRKKVGSKRTNSGSSGSSSKSAGSAASAPPPGPKQMARTETAQEVKARMMVVGSQKRKARKESITRREVTTVTATVDSIIVKEEIEGVSYGPNHNAMNNFNTNGGAADLLFLATIAEAMQ